MLRQSATNRRTFAKVYKNYLNGKWVASKGTSQFDIISPVSNQVGSH